MEDRNQVLTVANGDLAEQKIPMFTVQQGKFVEWGSK